MGQAMYRFETVVRPGHEAERVTTAFYRFLELHNVPLSEPASLSTDVLGDRERRTVVLWSEQAVDDFRRYLGAFRVEPPGGLPTPRPCALASDL